MKNRSVATAEGLRGRDYVLYSKFFADREDEGDRKSSVTQVGLSGLDVIQSYSYNFYGYRSPDFFDRPSILCTGDSHTFGVGLPLEGTWPYMLAKNLNYSYVNLGVPGGSVESIVLDIFHYIRTYGAPKHIVAVFPELDRHLFYSDPDVLISHSSKSGHGASNAQLGHLRVNYDRPFISKKPHKVEEVLPIHHAIMSSIKMIHLLEDFCDASNISLHWSLWDNDEQIELIKDLKKENKKYYRHFVDALSYNWLRDRESKTTSYSVDGNILDCHKDLESKYPETFHFGSDKYPHHDGVHRHAHLSDIFKQLITKGEN